MPHPLPHPFPHLPNKVRAEHDDISVFGEGLSGCQVANPLAGEARVAHHFNDVEGSPADIVAQHLELQTREGRGGEGEEKGRRGEGRERRGERRGGKWKGEEGSGREKRGVEGRRGEKRGEEKRGVEGRRGERRRGKWKGEEGEEGEEGRKGRGGEGRGGRGGKGSTKAFTECRNTHKYAEVQTMSSAFCCYQDTRGSQLLT